MIRATLSAEETAETLGIGRNLAYSLISEGRIPSLRLGNRIVVPKKELEKMIEREAGKEGEQ